MNQDPRISKKSGLCFPFIHIFSSWAHKTKSLSCKKLARGDDKETYFSGNLACQDLSRDLQNKKEIIESAQLSRKE